MSEREAVSLYNKVVEEVISEVRNDFEAAGIDEQTLQDLRRIWQNKLSELKVGSFSWDQDNEIDAQLQAQQGLKMEDMGGLILPGMVNQPTSGHATKEMPEIELTLDDPNNEIEKKLKEQAKQAKKEALLETDEINSDLDDSDDDYLANSDAEEEGDENIVLCLYEKVLRVKNKWKCNLKDGVATINKVEYAFHKANGESEW